MAGQTPDDDATHRVRPTRGADLDTLAPIEAAGGSQYVEHFGEDIHPILLSPPPDGRQRARQPGFLLVATDEDDRPIGFVHVMVIEGHAHLEQLSVLPEHQRQGVGRALIEAAKAEAREQGFDRMTLCTYRDVPWNGPYYAGLGFTQVDEADYLPYEARLHAKEQDLGLGVNGVRVVMEIELDSADESGS